MLNKKLVILCGPSGSGKTTVSHFLLKQIPELAFSISATTRAPRNNEVHNKDYYFIPTDDFIRKLASDSFVEFEEVYSGTFYGTLKTELERIWDEGKVPLLDIDVLGALNIKEKYAPNSLAVFVHPVNLENIKTRLIQRATESNESFEKRLTRAVEELNMCDLFDEVVYNDSLPNACNETLTLVKDYLQKPKR